MLPKLTIRGRILESPIIQGGMGVGISLAPLASAVATEGGAGIISSALIDRILSKQYGTTLNAHDAIIEEIHTAQNSTSTTGITGVNIMVYAAKDYADSVQGCVDAGADMIISGAGLPLQLPTIVGKADIAIIPIVSSLRALKIIHKRWLKHKRCIDAVVVEGPLAGGHLGFKSSEINCVSNKLENLFNPIKDFAQKNGDFPVIVAGGIYSNQDILNWISQGADGVQLGTRFLATEESTANIAFKQAVIHCNQEDIVLSSHIDNLPGSPSGMPFRLIKNSPMFQYSAYRKPSCTIGGVLQKNTKGQYTKCNAKKDSRQYFCICNGLLASAGYQRKEMPLWTVGSNAWKITEIISVKKLMNELKGI
jgi:nitronate monooxygenase